MSLANATFMQSFNCNHQELGSMPMSLLSYSEVSHSSSSNRIRPAAVYSFILHWYCPALWKNYVSLQTDIWEALCCGRKSCWRIVEGWIASSNNGLSWKFVPHRVELITLQNAFSDKLSHTGFDLFMMLVVDLLHEFELGVWKSIFIHLLRILEGLKQSRTSEMDKR